MDSGNPGADEEAVAAHEAGAILDDPEEGAGELGNSAAVLAQAGTGGQVENPDADKRKEEESGDPDVAGGLVGAELHGDEAAEHGDEQGKRGAEIFGVGGFGIRMGGPKDEHDDEQDEHGDEGVKGVPEGLAAEVAGGFALRDVEVFGHSTVIRYGAGFWNGEKG